MLKRTTKAQMKFLERKFEQLMATTPLSFALMTPIRVPAEAGVYVITAKAGRVEQAYYVGRTKNFRQRLYTQHFMGYEAGARLKKHMRESGECVDMRAAKEFLRERCQVRWIAQEGHRQRGALEGYVTALLFPKYGIYEEH